MPRWEYRSIQLWALTGADIGGQQRERKEGKQSGTGPALAGFGPEWEALLKQVGDEGWEVDQLVPGLHTNMGYYVALLRRPVPD